MRKLLLCLVLLLVSDAWAANKYVVFGCQYNGTGNADSCAASGGAAGAYSTLSNWEAQNASLSEVQNVYVRCATGSDSPTTSTNCSTADGGVNLYEWTTTQANYINIVVDANSRHDGKWNTAKYRISCSSPYQCFIAGKNISIRLDGIQIENTNTGSTILGSALGQTGTPGDVYITNSIVRNTSTGPALMYYDWASVNVTLRNNIFASGVTAGGPGVVELKGIFSGQVHNVMNNTIICTSTCDVGLLVQDYVNAAPDQYTYNIKNNLIVGTGLNSTECSAGASPNCYKKVGNGYATIVASNNATQDDSNPDSATTYDNSCTAASSVEDCFVDRANGDYHLITGADIQDDGADLSGTFTDDIDYQTRSGSWDIGADEYQASGPSLLLMRNARETD